MAELPIFITTNNNNTNTIYRRTRIYINKNIRRSHLYLPRMIGNVPNQSNSKRIAIIIVITGNLCCWLTIIRIGIKI